MWGYLLFNKTQIECKIKSSWTDSRPTKTSFFFVSYEILNRKEEQTAIKPPSMNLELGSFNLFILNCFGIISLRVFARLLEYLILSSNSQILCTWRKRFCVGLVWFGWVRLSHWTSMVYLLTKHHQTNAVCTAAGYCGYGDVNYIFVELTLV